jgi:hypothetical protein
MGNAGTALPNDDGPSEIETWSKETLTGFASLHLDEETSDVNIWVGPSKIPAHKIVLKIHSQLLNIGKTDHNSATNKMDIELLPEFIECSEVVSDIVESFYTGKISVRTDNAKTMYKFAKVYGVKLLENHIFPLLKDRLTSENFPSMFEYAQTVRCLKLTKACLRKFNNKVAEYMGESAEFLELDYYSIKVLSSSTHVRAFECKLFAVICKWLDYKPTERGGLAKSLLSNIRYDHMAQKTLINTVYPWIGESNTLDDETRAFLLKNVVLCSNKKESQSDTDRSSSPDTSSH